MTSGPQPTATAAPGTPASRSSAPASPGSAWRSGCSTTGSTTSTCSSGPTTSAAPGATTPIRAASATSPRRSTRSRSRPNPDWSRLYPLQSEIREYLRRVADERGVVPHIRFGHAVTGAAWDDDARRWRIETSARRAHGGRARGRDGRAHRAQASRHARDRALRGDDVPLGAVGSRPRPLRRAGRGHRHRRLVGPDRAQDPATGRRPAPVPAHAGVGDARRRPPRDRLRAPDVPARAGDAARRPRADLRPAGVDGARDDRRPAALDRVRADRPPAPAPAGPRPGAAREAHPELHARLQADHDVQHLLPRAQPAERGGRHRPDRRGHRARDPHRRRPRARARHDRLGDRLPRLRPPRVRGRPRARTAGPSTTPGRAARAPTSAPRSPAFPTSSCSSARTAPAATTRSSSPARRTSTTSPRCVREMDRSGVATVEVRPDVYDAFARETERTARRQRLEPRRLRELVPRRERAQRDLVAGLHRRTSGAAPAASTAAATSPSRPSRRLGTYRPGLPVSRVVSTAVAIALTGVLLGMSSPAPADHRDRGSRVDWRQSTALGTPAAGSLEHGVRFPGPGQPLLHLGPDPAPPARQRLAALGHRRPGAHGACTCCASSPAATRTPRGSASAT